MDAVYGWRETSSHQWRDAINCMPSEMECCVLRRWTQVTIPTVGTSHTYVARTAQWGTSQLDVVYGLSRLRVKSICQ